MPLGAQRLIITLSEFPRKPAFRNNRVDNRGLFAIKYAVEVRVGVMNPRRAWLRWKRIINGYHRGNRQTSALFSSLSALGTATKAKRFPTPTLPSRHGIRPVSAGHGRRFGKELYFDSFRPAVAFAADDRSVMGLRTCHRDGVSLGARPGIIHICFARASRPLSRVSTKPKVFKGVRP